MRGMQPYYDYMPYFLHDCFEGGKFSKFFQSDVEFISWAQTGKLEYFFHNGNIKKNNIKDLSGSGTYSKGVPEDINVLLDNYISILKERNKHFSYI